MVDRSIRDPRRVALAALLAGAALPLAPAAAQFPAATLSPSRDDPGERLAAALRTLSVSPADLSALIAAGQSALKLGDANAAVGFYGRADQISPRNGRVKAGLGASLVQLGRPADALRLFAEAGALGVPQADMASDRGLAHDLTGDPQAAQRDYRAALAARPDDDAARRRLALSQGIAGDRAAAIATLDPLIRRSDIAAWRAQTFVLAMTGDAAGANAITRVMLPQQQAALQPFLVRLAALSAADKARAVHFGEMPTSAVPGARMAAAAPPRAAAYPPPMPSTPSDLAPAAFASARIAARPAATAMPSRQTPPAAALAPSRTLAGSTATIAATPPPSPATRTLPAASLTAAATPPASVAPPSSGQAAANVAMAAAPSPATPAPRYVKRMRDWKDIALGASQYEYVPLAGIAQTPRRERIDMTSAFREPLGRTRAPVFAAAAAVPPSPPAVTTASAPGAAASIAPTPLSSPRPAPVAVPFPAAATPPAAQAAIAPAPTTADASTATPPLATALAPNAVAPSATRPASDPAGTATSPAAAMAPFREPATPPPASVAATVPEPGESTLSSPASPPPAASTLPLPAGGGVGHYDLPHAAADRRPSRVASPAAVASPPASASARTERHPRSDTQPAADREATTDRPHAARTATRSVRDEAATAPQADADVPSRSRPARDRKADHRERPAPAEDEAPPRSSKHARADADRPGRDEADAPARGKAADRASRGRRDDDAPAAKSARKKEDAAPHVYVQVAGGANRDDLGKAWAAVRKQAPDLMKGRSASTTPLRATNRLLVGPFKDEDEAQAFVNKAAGKGVSGFVFKSAKGQKVEKVDGGGTGKASGGE